MFNMREAFYLKNVTEIWFLLIFEDKDKVFLMKIQNLKRKLNI